MTRPSTAILSKKNLLHNLSVLKKMVFPAKIVAMIKANAYGHGGYSVGSILHDRADVLAVCSVDEAVSLRKAFPLASILLVQGVFCAEELSIASEYQLQVVFHNKEQIRWLNELILPHPIESWVKVNTGLGRLGFEKEEARDVYFQLLHSSKTKKPVRIMSHLSYAENPENLINTKQIASFQECIQGIDSEYSLCNSAGLLHFKDQHYHFVRPGILLYGVSPVPGKVGADFGVKPVMTVKSKIMSIETRKAGEAIGYGATYTLKKDTKVGCIAFGYGDGYPFSAQSGTPVLVDGRECFLIGKVAMDIMMVDLTSCKDAQVGSDVTLWGEGLPVERISAHSSHSVWHILTGIQSRVAYVWED